MTQICYTIGYTGRKLAEITRALDDRDAILFDIRYSPRSHNPVYNRLYLEAALKERYVWVKALGNVNYQLVSPVEILDYEYGRDRIAAASRPVILMCACENAVTCHRTYVADLLQADGYEVREIGRGDPGAVQPLLFEV